ncbi:hypothetical protein OEZ85_010438 [Tetradesmus obliquus]|uniref:Uncharacterized protein n=1 Tax=Tetradesmus obliquus TaxID=3088 RepID=A0ABY8TPF2_TETOB|nr:hypothetical protein OEZ85_010438 [Tetradesmus obliquus]
MGTPTASGRTWRDWLLPKKLLQWSEGEEGQEEAAGGQHDELFGQMARHSSEPDQRDSSAAAGGVSVLRRHSDGTAGVVSGRGGAGASSSRQQVQPWQGGEGAAADVAGRGPSSAPCSPRTPAAKDGTRQVQGPEGAGTAAAVGCAALELDSTAEQDVSRAPKQLVTAGGSAAAAVAAGAGELQLVQQFLASPEAAYLSPEMMHATLCCLPASDLQMALAYVVRQHEDTMTQPGQSDSEADTASQSVLPEDDAGCMPLFQLHHLDELSFEQLVEHIWPGELEEGAAGAPASSTAGSAAASSVKAAASAGKGGKAAQQLRSKQLSALGKSERGASAAATAAAAAAAAAAKQQLKEQPKLLPASWWLEHLQQSGKAADPPPAAAADQRVLRWLYGNIVSSQAEEFAAGQAALSCNLDRQTALLELYEGMANAWRRMQRVADKRRVLEQLRQNIKTQFAVVRSQEEAGEHCTAQQAVTFLEALFTSLCTTNSSNPAASKAASSSADPSSSSAAANGDALAAAHEDDTAAARQKLAGANERLLARRAELSTAEAEHSRLTAEGPASHRKKDFLDKATKEAEHREKLADLKAKIDAAKAAISEDEVTAAAADLAAADAQGDLARVREQARQIAARKKNLEDLNAQLSAPVPPLSEAALAAAVSSGSSSAGNLGALAPVPGAAAAAATAAAAAAAASVKLFQAQYEPRGKQYELLVRASKWVKECCDEYDLTFQAAAEDLNNLRNRVQQLACVDLTFDINEAALKYIRRVVEAEAARAQELRSQQLLQELAAEEEAVKAQQQQQQQHGRMPLR